MYCDSRGFTILSVLTIALLGILTNHALASDVRPILYCVAQNSPYHISTLDAALPQAKCFRVQNGLITEVLEQPLGDEDTAIVLDGYVIPGIIESHGHFLQYGEMLESVLLYGAESIEEVRTRIKSFLEAHPGEGYGSRKKWIRGIGWDQAYFGGVMPTAKELGDDPVLAGLYIMLDRVDVHCVWTSQKVIDLLPSPLPEASSGGVIVSDPGFGVFCDNAIDAIVYPVAPKPGVAQKTRWFKAAMSELNKFGIVGVSDAGIRADDISILESLAEKDELSLRINVMLECEERNSFCPEETWDLKLLESLNGLGDGTLHLGGVKLFADGALGSWGAALLEPYSDKPETSGTMLINETQLTAVVGQWYKAGFQVNIHAIGDRANRAAVDAFEAVLGPDCDGCNEGRRLRIEHAQIIHPDEQKRIAKMGIIPSIQPTHATSDMAYAVDRLGEKRLSESAYRMASFFPTSLNTNTKYRGPVLGSDFPVEPPNPFHGMYAAVTRLSPLTKTSPSGSSGWYPSEALTVEQALLGFTQNAAYGWFKEAKAGSIEVGKWADWVVVDKNILADKTGAALLDVHVLETWVGGKKVWPIHEEAPADWLRFSIKYLGETILWMMPVGLTGMEPEWQDPDAEAPKLGLVDNRPRLTPLIKKLYNFGKGYLLPVASAEKTPKKVRTDPRLEPMRKDDPLENFIAKVGQTILGWMPGIITGQESEWKDPAAEGSRVGPIRRLLKRALFGKQYNHEEL